jgi:RNA polymerase sigma-70 factor (ECF subfamily)
MPLVKHKKSGALETAAWRIEEYYDKVYVYIYRRVNNPHDAEDLTADVFEKALANPYDPRIARFSTYIYTIAANVLKNHYRSAAVRKIIVPGEPEEDLPYDADLPGGLVTREEYDKLKEAVAGLPPRHYEVVYRRYFLDESYKDIAAALDITETNARKLHFTAVRQLKKILDRGNETAPRVYNIS